VTTPRWLRVAAGVEAVTVIALFVNLATVHLPAVASMLGPVHGTAYLAGIALAWTGGLPRSARLLACVPAVGAWLAARAAGRESVRHRPAPTEEKQR
jgi:hypothetical protein